MKRIIDFIKKNLKWFIAGICFVLFLLIAEDVFEKEIMNGDIIGYDIIRKYFISNRITPITKSITNMGSAYVIGSVIVILFFVIKNKKIWASIIINLSSITLLNLLLKNIFSRDRPTGFRIIDETGFSFPSGHSMISMAFYGYFIYLIYKYIKNKYVKWVSIILLSMLIITIGISRIYLGVHYTSDVFGGFLFSISYLIVYITIMKKRLL